MWQDNVETVNIKLNWKDSLHFCSQLSLNNYQDWRLPSLSELRSIVDKSNSPSIKNGIKNIKARIYWSSTEQSRLRAKGIFFFNGSSSKKEKKEKKGVRCVRN